MHHGYHHGMRHGKGAHHGRHMFRMLDAYDTNQDGKLSKEEIDQARGERLGKFDADGDQSLNLREYEQLWLDAMSAGVCDPFSDLEADGEGQVHGEERTMRGSGARGSDT